MLHVILPVFNGTESGKHPIIARVLKGIFRNHPALPRYMVTCDRDFDEFSNILTIIGQYHTERANTKNCHHLSIFGNRCQIKNSSLLVWALRHRCQSINSLTLARIDINININRVTFYIPKVIENTARSFHSQLIKLKA